MKSCNENNKLLKNIQETFTSIGVINELLEKDGQFVLRAEINDLGVKLGKGLLDVVVIPLPAEDGEINELLLVHTTLTRDFEDENLPMALVALNNINQMTSVGAFLVNLEERTVFHKYTIKLEADDSDEQISKQAHSAITEVLGLLDIMYDDILILSNDAEGFLRLIELENSEQEQE